MSDAIDLIVSERQVEALADDAFAQAAQGYAVQLSPEQADDLGAFEETALSVDDIMADAALTNGNPVVE